ncbi:MAG: molybdopterin molybdotransferase MoeA [bacterium]|nr:molybdopterin molybdotransferase MoeA [bacterium]
MTPVDEAIKIMLDSIKPLNGEIVPVPESDGRIIYEDIISEIQVPPLNNSAMDGYALLSEESSAASKENPITLTVIDEIQAGGEHEGKELLPGTAIRIMTGAPIPAGADSVIPVEDTSEEAGVVSIYKSLAVHENVRFAGEDIAVGQTVLRKGDKIRSADVGLLVSLNRSEVTVFKRPEIGIISTGDEIVDMGEEIQPGQIRNSNAYTLYAEIKKYNAVPHYLGIAKDTPEDSKAKFIKGLEFDMVITTGGVSMGKYDFVKDIMRDLGVEISIETLRMKPGKPLAFGTRGKTLFFGLPGNPVSTMVSFIQFVRPAILTFMGAGKIKKPEVKAVLEGDIRKKAGRKNYIRAYFTIKDNIFTVSTTGPQGSGILRSMSEANCLIILPEEVTSAAAGEEVTIQLINHEEI